MHVLKQIILKKELQVSIYLGTWVHNKRQNRKARKHLQTKPTREPIKYSNADQNQLWSLGQSMRGKFRTHSIRSPNPSSQNIWFNNQCSILCYDTAHFPLSVVSTRYRGSSIGILVFIWHLWISSKSRQDFILFWQKIRQFFPKRITEPTERSVESHLSLYLFLKNQKSKFMFNVS